MSVLAHPVFDPGSLPFDHHPLYRGWFFVVYYHLLPPFFHGDDGVTLRVRYRLPGEKSAMWSRKSRKMVNAKREGMWEGLSLSGHLAEWKDGARRDRFVGYAWIRLKRCWCIYFTVSFERKGGFLISVKSIDAVWTAWGEKWSGEASFTGLT